MADEKKAQEAAPAAGQEQPAKGKKRLKINEMDIKVLDKKIEEVKEKMGGLHSKYAHQLLKRKKELIG